MDTTVPTTESVSAAFSTPEDEAFGACFCPEFAPGRRELHIAGQPGCAYEVHADAA
ncbi:hypothetical protein ACOBQX_30150 [Actinokineospora sp. G85]|uniref:hypothetical protein n=1 Tax=Actinokineospora sp. G85 TaxID=3406626 RepID=UPI003C76D03A